MMHLGNGDMENGLLQLRS